MSKESKTYKIFSLKLAKLLCDDGFQVINVIPNRQKPWLNVYLFEDNKELQLAIQKYKQYCKG